MKFGKKLKISLITTIVTFVTCFGGYTIFAADENTPYFDFSDPAKGFYLVKASYHISMNEFFNNQLEKLNTILATEDFYNNPELMKQLNAPEGDTNLTNFKEKCAGNISTYCVSLNAMDMYIIYLQTLQKIKQSIIVEELDTQSSWYIKNIQSTTLLNVINSRNQAIAQEIVTAKEVMNGTIAAYDEFKLAFPMHKKYEEIIDNLIKFRRALKILRNEISRFPGKFIDVTSSACE